MREDERDRVSRLGSEAWKRLKKCKDYNDWIKVGDALQVGREWAMNQADAGPTSRKARATIFASPNICSATSSTTWTRATAHGCFR